MRRVFLVLVDGLCPDVAERWLAQGSLPNLARMMEGGGHTRAVTVFPSTTGVAYLPLLTGCSPGRADVPSIRWIDRRHYRGRWWRERDAVRSYCGYQAGYLDRDIAPGIRTLFELVPESIGLFTPIARGLSPDRDPTRRARTLWGAVAHVLQWHQPSDDCVARHLLRAVEGPWRFVFAQFPAVDGYTHQRHPDHPLVRRACEQVDRTVGRVMERLALRGEAEETLILLVSDHGATPILEHLDLAEWFRDRGIPTLAHPTLWTATPRVAVTVAGNASAMVYARPGTPRTTRWPLSELRAPEAFGHREDLVAALAREPSVAFLAGQEGPEVHLVGGRGGTTTAVLRPAGDRITYERRGGDPLQLGEDFSGDHAAWLARSWDTPFPDAAVQLVSLFGSPRTGDLVVVANHGFDFRRRFEIPEHRAGHGSLLREHMQIPLWSNRPVPAEVLRSADLFPTMLEWLGVPIPGGIDGVLRWRAAASVPPRGRSRAVAAIGV